MSNFTLKEAFICAGALLLIAITAPLAIGNATNDAKLSACADKLRQVGAAQLSYAENNKSFLPMNEKNFIKGGGMARAATYSTAMPPMVLIMQGYFKKGAADGEKVIGGNILVRQRGTKIHPGTNVGIGDDDTLYAKMDGIVKFERYDKTRKQVSIYPKTEVAAE